MYTIFLRSHNNIAYRLRITKPTMSDSRIFQLARNINEAIYQKIVFEEWTKVVLGNIKAQQILEATPEATPERNRGVSNEFATAAIRFYYSMMPGDLTLTREYEHLYSSNIVSKSR